MAQRARKCAPTDRNLGGTHGPVSRHPGRRSWTGLRHEPVSDAEHPGPEGRRETGIWGHASDEAHVYQAQGSQYISHVHLHADADPSGGAALTQPGMRGAALERTQHRVTLLIQALSLTEAEWQARCVRLEDTARRARAEGRAEALAEVQEQLKAAELRVMKAQQMMRDAVLEREKSEALLAQAQQELAQRRLAEERREEEEHARRSAEARAEAESASAARLHREGEQFTEFLERAEAELGAVRDDLRVLGEEMTGGGGSEAGVQVIEGDWVRHPGEDDDVADPSSPDVPWSVVELDRPTRRARQLDPPRYFLIGVVWLLCVIPTWIPMLVVTSNRAAYASDPSLAQALLFTGGTALLGTVAHLLITLLVTWMMFDKLDRTSETIAGEWGSMVLVLGSLGMFLAAFFTPLTQPGPAGAWGRAIASAVGLG